MAYLAKKLQNDIRKANMAFGLPLAFKLSNYRRNGTSTGCSGFVVDMTTKCCVYVSTEKSCYAPLSDQNLLRYAADTSDYSSNRLGVRGRNRYCTDRELPGAIMALLAANPE